MKKHYYFLLALTLVFGAKVFGQEWQWNYSQPERTYSGFMETHELLDGRIIATGAFHEKNVCENYVLQHPVLLKLDSDGTELAFSEYYKDGYFGYSPLVLENESGEVFALMAFSPDHDTCSTNYFMNYEPITDHCILGLYKLNDDLSIAESHEFEIPIDTFEWRSTDNIFYPYNSGQTQIYSAFVDDDGTIVGAYYKSVSYVSDESRGYDSTVFFRLDFDGNLLNRVSYCGNVRHGVIPDLVYQRQHIVKADSLYLHYGIIYDVISDGEKNLAYLDYDFNLVRSRCFRHPSGVHPFAGNITFQNFNAVRNRQGRTYLTSSVVEMDDEYCCVLYEYNDDINGSSGSAPIVRFAERKTLGHTYDFPSVFSGVSLLDDDSFYFAYDLDEGWYYNRDSWLVMERLTPEFDTISTLFYGLQDGICNTTNSITATRDGGLILVTGITALDGSNYGCSILKFPAEAFEGIDEAHDNGLKVAIAYPNPGKDVLNIRTGLKDAWVEVYDMSGRMICGQEITENVTSINAEGWLSGIYVWKVIANGKEAESGKWIKQ
jgi:hypothetical protein